MKTKIVILTNEQKTVYNCTITKARGDFKMKRFIALLCVLTLMLTLLVACGEKVSDEGQKNEMGAVSGDTSSKKDDESAVISIEKIKKAFEDAGYTAILGNAEFWKQEAKKEENVTEIKTCTVTINSEDRKNEMGVSFYQYVCDSKENAEKRFDEYLAHQKTSNNIEFTKNNINGYSKAFGKIDTDSKKVVTIVWQKENVHMYVIIDWTMFGKSGIDYDDSAEKIFEKLGL